VGSPYSKILTVANESAKAVERKAMEELGLTWSVTDIEPVYAAESNLEKFNVKASQLPKLSSKRKPASSARRRTRLLLW